MSMQLILLSGGSGKRLWPLSNDVRSKQFLKVLKNPAGESESMVQRVYRQIKEAAITDSITIASSATQEESLRDQLGDDVHLVLEPERRDTFPAITLACSYLALEKHVSLDEVVVVLPVDVYADIAYFNTFKEMEQVVLSNKAEIALMGIQPDYPSQKFGYILPGAQISDGSHMVEGFVEKPDSVRAKELLTKGAYWNGGVFAFKLGYLMNNEETSLPSQSFAEVYANYGKLKKTSFDYEVVEQCSHLAMVSYKGNWKDLGSWNVLTTVLDNPLSGIGVIAEDQGNTHVINHLDIPVLALGTKNLVIAASYDGILVADLDHSTTLKEHAQKLTKAPRYEEHRFGNAQVIDTPISESGEETRIRRLMIFPDSKTKPLLDNESLVLLIVVSGVGSVAIGDEMKSLHKGAVVHIPKGVGYQIVSQTELIVLEVPITD